MFQMTSQELRTFEARLADKAARGNGVAHDTQEKLRMCSNDVERIEHLRGIIEQAQRAAFWAKGLQKTKRKNVNRIELLQRQQPRLRCDVARVDSCGRGCKRNS